MIRQFSGDPANEFGMAAFLKPGSVWVLLRSREFSLHRDYSSFDYFEKGTCILILHYSAKMRDHLIKFLCGKSIYSCCIPRGSLRNELGLLAEATQNYQTELD